MTEPLSALVERVLDGRPSEPSDHHAWYYTRGDVDAVAQAVSESNARTITCLREALMQHRSDLHEWSGRPCPTCTLSARALGIHGAVPNQCGRTGTDAAAIRAAGEGE